MAESSPSARERIDVFEYVDYRAFLRDYYAHEKRVRRSFSHRAFSRRVGLGSPNHLKRVMDGERNLTVEMAERFAGALALSGEAAEYFVQLVRFGQARSSVERARAYEKLAGFKAYRRTRKLDLAHAAYHSTWYLPAIARRSGKLRPIAATFTRTPSSGAIGAGASSSRRTSR